MEHISFHDICIIMDALKLYTKQMKEMESNTDIPSEFAKTQLHENIERSIALRKLFSGVSDKLAVIDENLSVNIVAKFYNG